MKHLRGLATLSVVRPPTRYVFIGLLSISLASCGVMTHWIDDPELIGPLLFGKERSQGVKRCALVRNVSGGPCEYGFIDQKRNVIPRKTIEQEVSNYLISHEIPISHFDQIYILTISPTVVMLVPDQSIAQSNTKNQTVRETPSRMERLMYNRSPIKGVNSMIFVAGTNLRPTRIADNTDSIELSLYDSTLKITSMGTHWNVERYPNRPIGASTDQ